ncbi:MAG TPA: hydroxyisourate hydrolase [Ktedonobacter sp.]|nr:hydroxyisourate hydrolase [Ktedonobacter sp.]
MGRLTTHVLDTAQGCPAPRVPIELWRCNQEGEQDILLKTVYTNSDGRTDEPLLADVELVAGIYQLVFSVGHYFAAETGTSSTCPFLDRIPVRFGIENPKAHYHVPLLVSPWAYSTYRGS